MSNEADLLAVSVELQSEHQNILYPLLERMSTVSATLMDGTDVDAEYVTSLLTLLGRYLTDVHVRRVRTLLNPAMARTDVAATVRYREIVGDLEREKAYLDDLKRILRYYISTPYAGRIILASMLRTGVVSGRTWAKYEEEFASRFLSGSLGEAADRNLRTSVAACHEIAAALEHDVTEFTSRPVPSHGTATSPPTTQPPTSRPPSNPPRVVAPVG
jgi:hypothetical protein